jgi:2-polyprenyl-3-methyl-5-hydroxy-6-metoxy-1,4-benzoquinol methylase
MNCSPLLESTCDCCGAAFWKEIHFRKTATYFRCSSCGYHLMVHTGGEDKRAAFSKEQEKFYSERSLLLSPLVRDLETESLKVRMPIIQKYLKSKSRLLEVGPGTGTTVAALLGLQHRVDAVEESPILANQIKQKYGIHIIEGQFEAAEIEHESYDGYLSFHVIEHVVDVHQHLKAAHAAVKPGGYAFIATPNADSWQHNLPKRLSPNYDSAHLQLFTPKALMLCLENAGWRCRRVYTPEYTTNWIRVGTKLIRRIRGREETDVGGEFVGLFEDNQNSLRVILGLFRLLSAPIRALQSYLRKGNELLVVAQKPMSDL